MTISILPNIDKNGCLETLGKIGAFFKKKGIKAYIPETVCCPDMECVSEDELFEKGDFIVTIGGDGTIIRYAKKAAQAKKPILGINAGRMGYLANIEQSEYELLGRLATGEYTTERRMMLEITVIDENGHKTVCNALNDAVITSGYVSRIIDVYAAVENESIHYRADGIIVATPTGSTAYSLSAGGPVIDSAAQCMCITPICSHSLSAKPIILGADRTLRINAFSKKRADIYLTVDGRRLTQIKQKTKITVRKSDEYVELIRLNDKNFYSTLSMKFSDISK